MKSKGKLDISKYCGAIKDVYGDGLEYQKKVRAEWDRDLMGLLIKGPVMDNKEFKAFKSNRKKLGSLD